MFSPKIDPEEKERYIGRFVDFIIKNNLEIAAITALTLHKPLALYYTSLGRISILPYAILFGRGNTAGKILTILENKENVEEIIKLIEEKQNEKTQK
jgi:hypothetical protein